MWARLPALLLAVAAAALLGACGDEGGEPKRTVDAKAEALRFFAPDTPFVALVDPTPGEDSDTAATLESLAGVGAVSAFARNDLGFISAQGLSTSGLPGLLESSDPALESEESQIAVGVRPTGTPDEDALVVIVTAKPDEAADAVADAAGSSGMKASGTYDEARLYTGNAAAMAVRDGVILIAPSEGRVREAIDDRDAGDDSHLDDGHVDSVLDAAPEDAPLVAYLDVGELARTDPGVAALGSGGGVDWLGELGEAELAVVPGDPNEITFTAQVREGTEASVPLEEEPERIPLDRAAVASAAAGESAPASGFHDALTSLAPATLTVSATDDEVRARVTTER